MTVLNISLRAQLAWFFAASIYNAMSLMAIANGDQGFAGDAPTTQVAMLAVIFFGVVTCAGIFGRLMIYKSLAPLVFIALITGGVIKHLVSGPAGYASILSWNLAILINIFGAAAFGVGVVAAFLND